MKQYADFRSKAVLGLYVACFSVGALNHARDFLTYGWRPYSIGPLPLEIFWNSLLFLDVLAALLIVSRFRRAGLLLSVGIMISDVAANTYALVVLNIPAFGLTVPLQATFLGFVLGSIAFVWSSKPSTLQAERLD